MHERPPKHWHGLQAKPCRCAPTVRLACCLVSVPAAGLAVLNASRLCAQQQVRLVPGPVLPGRNLHTAVPAFGEQLTRSVSVRGAANGEAALLVQVAA